MLHNFCIVVGADVFIATDAVELTPANLAYYGEAVVGTLAHHDLYSITPQPLLTNTHTHTQVRTYGAQPRTPQETKTLFRDAGGDVEVHRHCNTAVQPL
jgi:hypothetical protein